MMGYSINTVLVNNNNVEEFAEYGIPSKDKFLTVNEQWNNHKGDSMIAFYLSISDDDGKQTKCTEIPDNWDDIRKEVLTKLIETIAGSTWGSNDL
jgi:hypothetical protein